MASGSYAVDGVVEQFRCGPVPQGWHYRGVRAGLTVDLVADPAWRVVRLALDGPAQVRGGVVGERVVWRRDDRGHEAVASGPTGDSPGFAVLTARMLALDVGGRTRVALVRFGPALGALTVQQGWTRTPDVEGTERYEVADLATGVRGVLHLAGDVVVAATGVDLLSLDPAAGDP